MVNILCVAQKGRLQYEALAFMASFTHFNRGSDFTVFIAEPQPGDLWPEDPRIEEPIRIQLVDMGATILPFESEMFGADYPHGNKIEALKALPKGEPFVFFDTDTLFLGPLSEVPFDFNIPGASLRREGTWPEPDLYGPGYHEIWASLYRKFRIPFKSSIDESQPKEYWKRYLYFNAGYFFYKDPAKFHELFLKYATAIRDTPPDELDGQAMYPWLDQIALPLVIHKLGGRRDALPDGLLDGRITCHYRALPLLYAREDQRVIDVMEEVTAPNKVKKLLKEHEPFKRLVFQNRGQKLRSIIDENDLMKPEEKLRKKLKNRGFWMR